MVRQIIDAVGSAVLMLLTAPLFVVTALLIWLEDRGPIFYQQARVGLNGRQFQALKFRSMQVNNLPAPESEVAKDDPLVTGVGKWIRRFKIDELPQLFNVLCGDMSLIGPRPTLPEQVEQYSAFQHRRHEVRPGMTGWAQVNGGIAVSWPVRIMLDVWYVDHRSIALDIRILLRTAIVVLFGDQLNQKALQKATSYFNHCTSKLPSGSELFSATSASRLASFENQRLSS